MQKWEARIGLAAGALGTLMLAAKAAPGKLASDGLVGLRPWPEDSVNRVQNPSFEELDGDGWIASWTRGEPAHHLSFMAVVAGAKRLFYWSYGAQGLESVANPREKREIWQRLVRVTKEIKSLEPALFGPDVPEILSEHSPGAIRVLSKRLSETRYVIAVHNTPARADAVFMLPEPVGAVEVLGENRRFSPNGSQSYADLFAPYATHVYRIDRPRSR